MKWLSAASLLIPLATASCAGSSAWTPLYPLADRSAVSVQKAEKAFKKVTVSTQISQNKKRYLARFHIQNDSDKTLHGPTDLTLADFEGTTHEPIPRER